MDADAVVKNRPLPFKLSSHRVRYQCQMILKICSSLPIAERSLFAVSDEEGGAKILYRPAERAHRLSRSC
jgi:hypothetical protein